MWQSPRVEGFVELEQDFARLLKNTHGQTWVSRTLTPADGSIWGALRQEIPTFFPAGAQLHFLNSDQGGVRSLDFPQEFAEAEISSNLQIKRKEFFNTHEELLFRVKLQAARPDKTREAIVSFLPKAILEQAETLCRETGFSLGKVTTAVDALLGAFQRQLQRPTQETGIILQIGFSQVHLVAVRNQEILAVRSLLTGSLRELENLLFTGFSLSRTDIWPMLSGSKPMMVPAIGEAVKTNRQELMTHIGSLFSELRSKKWLSEKSALFLSTPLVEEPELASMIAERFGIAVESLTGLQPDENADSAEDAKAAWLTGAQLPAATNLVPPVPRSAIQLAVSFRTAVITVLVLAAAPLPFLNILKMRSARELAHWKEQHVSIETLVQKFSEAEAEQGKLVALAKEITKDIDRRGLSTRLTRHITEGLPPFTRLERLEINQKDSKLQVTGYTVDTETALRFLDTIKAFPDLSEPEIVVGDLESRRIRFDISAVIGKKG